jgi:hypothetical protein
MSQMESSLGSIDSGSLSEIGTPSLLLSRRFAYSAAPFVAFACDAAYASIDL